MSCTRESSLSRDHICVVRFDFVGARRRPKFEGVRVLNTVRIVAYTLNLINERVIYEN